MAADYAHRLCPEAIFIKPDFSFYEEYSRKVHQILSRFSPIVAMTSIDEAYLDITGSERLFGEPIELGRKIKEEIRKLGLPSTVGIAKNPTLAKIATNLAKPDGLLYIPAGKEANYINHLDIEMVPGIGERTAKVLRDAGIKTIGDFLKGDKEKMRSLIGKWAEDLWENLTAERGLAIREGRKSISRNTTLQWNTREPNVLESALYQLLKDACEGMREEGWKTTTLTCRVRFADFLTITKRKKVSPTDAHQLLFPVAKRLLSFLMGRSEKKVRLVGVTLSGFTKTNLLQLSFFPPMERMTDFVRLNQTLDHLRKRFGEDKVKEGRLFWRRETD